MIGSEVGDAYAEHLNDNNVSENITRAAAGAADQALPLRLQQRAPRLQPQLRVAGIAGRKARGSGPVQQRQIEMRRAEAIDAALSQRVGTAARA